MPSFFLVTRRPHSPTLFPYTTLFRSVSFETGEVCEAGSASATKPGQLVPAIGVRSEEHTSELQSRLDISYAVFFFSDTPTTQPYTLSLHDALPICVVRDRRSVRSGIGVRDEAGAISSGDRS